MINFIKDAVTAVSGIKTFLFNTDYRNNFDLQHVEFPCCVLTPIMEKNYDLKNIIHEKAKLQMSIVELAPYDYTGDDLYAINKRCSDIALQVIANLQVKSKLDKELAFEFILPSGDELVSGVMCNLQVTMKQGSCIGAPSYVEIVVQPIKKESITRNGKHVISADKGFNAMREVEVDVNVDLKGSLQDKQVTITENGTTTITADEEFEGLNSVEVVSEVYDGFDLTEFGTTKKYSKKTNEDFWEIVRASENYTGSKPKAGGIVLSNTFQLPSNADFYGSGHFALFWTFSIDYTKVTSYLRGVFNNIVVVNFGGHVYIPNATTINSLIANSTIINASDITFDFGDNTSIQASITDPLANCKIINDSLKKITFKGKRIKQLYGVNSYYFIKKYVDVEFLDSENCTSIAIGECKFVNVGDVSQANTLIFRDNKDVRFLNWAKTDCNLSMNSFNTMPSSSIRYIIWHALNGENTLGFENEGATSRTLRLHATPYASWEEWKTTKPSVDDCESLDVDETEITKYGELTWEDIALNIKLITIAK